MTRTYKRWIFTKSCDNTPNGNLQLGQILAEAKDPAHILQPKGPLPLADYDIVPEVGDRSNVNLHDVDDLSAQFSAWASLGYVPVQAKTISKGTRTHDLAWHFDKLESRIVSPSLEYVKDAMRHGDVEESLRTWRWPWKRRVYMVTGVRIVHNARMKLKDTSTTNNQLVAQGAAPDQSVSAGTQGGVATKSMGSEEFDKASDFVFAYRLNRVKYRGVVAHKPYTKGETESVDRPSGPRGPAVEMNDFEVVGSGLEEIDFEDEEDDFDRVEAEGVEHESYLPKAEDEDE